jgi:hypothetical protein
MMKKFELVNTLASKLASKDGIQLQDASPKLQNKYISIVITVFATLEDLGFHIVPSAEGSVYKNTTMLEAILNTWCEEFAIEPNWPDNICPEEKFDRYFFPQVQEALTHIEKDREYYQNRFYMMKWAFRKFLNTYGQVAKEFKLANIQFLSDDLVRDLIRGEETTNSGL